MANVLGIKSVKSTTPTSSQSSKKRKASQLSQDVYPVVATTRDKLAIAGSPTEQKVCKKKGEELEEKRLKRFRLEPPNSYLERLERAKAQRMFLIDRNRSTSEDGNHEEEVFDIAGTTGNIYQVTVSKVPTCTCPDAGKGNQCKHIVYVSILPGFSWMMLITCARSSSTF